MLTSVVAALRARPTQTDRVSAGADSVSVRGITKSFGSTPVLTGIDLDVPAATVVALLGPSGSGKTTLLRTIAGLERADSGSVRIGERVVDGDRSFVPPEKRRVGMVFQDWALFPHLSVARNVGFGLSRGERESGRVEETLALVDLAGFGPRLPATLSGGQQQRVAVARALAQRPSVVLLDEPFSNLDAALRQQIRLETQHLLRELGVTTLFVTHQQEEAFVVGEQVAVMLDGVIEQQAPASDLYAAPATRALAQFVGDANFVPGRASGTKAETRLGVVPLRHDVHGPVEVMLRPEQIELFEGDIATLESIEFYGHDAICLLRLDDGSPLRARVLGAPAFRPGDRVAVGFNGTRAVAYPSSR